MTRGKTRARDLQLGYGLKSSGVPPAEHDAAMVDVPTIAPDILAELAWIQQDVFTQFNDGLEGTETGTPTFAIGDRVQIYAPDDITPRGDATLVFYDNSGGPVEMGLDDDDAKALYGIGDKVWPEGATPGVGGFLTIDGVGDQYATGGGRYRFPLSLGGETLIVDSIELYRNGVIQQMVADETTAEKLGPSFFYYDATPGSELVGFGPTYSPTQGEELILRSRLA